MQAGLDLHCNSVDYTLYSFVGLSLTLNDIYLIDSLNLY